MHPHLEPQTAPSRAERAALDEALFCTERCFDPAELPVYLPPVPPTVLPPSSLPEYFTAPVSAPEYALPSDDFTPAPSGAVSDAGGSYQLMNLAPGLYEIRPPAPAPALATAECHPEELAPVPTPVTPERHLEEPAPEPPPPEPQMTLPEPTAREPEEPAPEPPALQLRELRVEVNAGFEVGPGEEVRIGPDILRIDGAEPRLIALMLLSPPIHGVLLREGFALTGGDLFTQEDLDVGRIGYRHEGDANDGEDYFSFATPECEILPTQVDIRVVVRRLAPRLLGGGRLDGIAKGIAVSDILDGQADADAECGLAVVGVAGSGVWMFSLDEGRTWRSSGETRPARALVLGPSDRLRFTAREGVGTVARLQYRAWDRSSRIPGDRADLEPRDAVGGTSAFSQEVTSATLRLEPSITIAECPVADPWKVPLTGDDLAGGGVAVVRLAGAGIWQWSVGGTAWRDCKSVYHGRALLLGAADRLRFVPLPGMSGRVSLALRSWDGGEGMRGGHTSLSARGSVGGDTGFGESVQSYDWYLDAA